MTAATALCWSALLTWLMLATASFLRARAWNSAGLRIALGNRDDLPPPTGLAGRADRAARNMVENLVLLVALVAAVYFAGRHDRIADAGATIFFWSRLAYWPCYLAGIVYLRTIIWFASVIGLAFVASALWQA
jgi:uncharacterized MAPEG superfamily protein